MKTCAPNGRLAPKLALALFLAAVVSSRAFPGGADADIPDELLQIGRSHTEAISRLRTCKATAEVWQWSNEGLNLFTVGEGGPQGKNRADVSDHPVNMD